MTAPNSSSPYSIWSDAAVCGDADQPSQVSSSAGSIGLDDFSVAITEPVSNVSTPSSIRGGSYVSPSTIRGGISRARSATSSTDTLLDAVDDDSSMGSLDSTPSSEGSLSIRSTETTVNSDSEASSICRMIDDDPEFDTLRLNSVAVSHIPDRIIFVDELSVNAEEDDYSVEELLEEFPYVPTTDGICDLQLSEIACDTSSNAKIYQAHLDGGSQASTTHDLSVMWGYKPFTRQKPCRVRLLCADGKKPIVPTGYGIVRIPAENKAGYVPLPCYYTPELLNFIVSPKSFEPLLGKNHNGYTIDCRKEDDSFKFTAKHKLRNSEAIHVCGETINGLCYTKPAIVPKPQAEDNASLTLEEADKKGVSATENHRNNSVGHELMVHKLSVKQERLLWHQRLGHCGSEQLCRAHMFCDGVPKISPKTSVVDNCPVCLAANMRARDRGDGDTRTATVAGQGLSIDFSFAGQTSKNSTDPDRMRINDYMGLHGETCYLLVYDHATERLEGVCKQSKAPPVAWLRRWLRKNVDKDVKNRYVFMDQGGELYKSKAIRDLFEKEFDYDIRVTGTAAHHQNGLVERANQTVDKAIRALLIGAGLEVKFWPYAFYHFLRIKNAALPRREATESAFQKLNGRKDDLSLLKTFGCRVWVKILAWKNKAKYVQDTKKGIFLGYLTNTLKNVVWYDPLTNRVKYGYHVRFDEGFNDLPNASLPPNVMLLERHEERMPAERMSITIPPFSTSEHPFFNLHDVVVEAICDHPTYGFALKEDDCMNRVFISGFEKNGKNKNRHYSCNTIASTERAVRGKYNGAYITSIGDNAIVTIEQAKEKFEELRSKKVESFHMTLACEPKPSKQMTRRAYDELEMPAFDIDEELGADYLNHEELREPSSSLSTSNVTKNSSSLTPENPVIGTCIHKDFNGKSFQGKVVSGPHGVQDKHGNTVQVWKIKYSDGDREEMTASEIDKYKTPVDIVNTSRKAVRSSKPSGDHVEELPPDPIPIPDTTTHKRRSTRLQQERKEQARMNFLENNPYLPMDSLSMYEAATCRIHLSDDDPYDELLHNVDEVETLLQDPSIIAAIHRLLDPDFDTQEMKMSALQSEAITTEEKALPRFSRRSLQRLPTWDLWHKNEVEQLDQMNALGMFGAPVKLPEGGILMRFHWQYRIKVNGKRRSRVCCDGSPRAAPEVHSSTNTYASCLEHPIFRLFVALCAADNLTIYGGDAKDAFAHSPGPSRPTFMKVDDAFRDWYRMRTGTTLDKDLVLPVLRALQGHPEAARLWEEHISEILRTIGFKNTTHEKNIYTGFFKGEKVLLVRQVDDFAFGCKNESTAKYICSLIGTKLKLHNESEEPFDYLGLVDSFDGYDILQTRDYIKISAESYIRRLLKAHNWDNPSPKECSRKPKPPLHESDVAGLFNLEAGPKENTPEHKELEQRMGFGYRSVLGEILFAYVLCRPDIGYAVTTLAKFSTSPNELHYKSLKHLAIYLRQTQDWGIIYWRSSPVESLPDVPVILMTFDDSLPTIPPPKSLYQLITHVDAAHANELRQRRSTTGYGCCLAGGVVAYRSRTQSICAQSSTEAELIAANSAAKVTKYLRFVLRELGYTQTDPTPIYEDNDSAIKIVNHNRPTDRSRHIEIRFFALQHWRIMRDIVLVHLPGVVNPADMLTKALGWVLHHRHAPYMMGHYGNPCR